MAKRKVTSSNNINREKLINVCGMVYAIDILGGRWKLLILYKLETKTLRFGELKKMIPDISDRMLTLHLQDLERDGLVSRTIYAEVPPRVEYKLTASAMSLIPIWQNLNDWGHAHKEIIGQHLPG